MPETREPDKAIVSVWQDRSFEAFLGSAAFITPRWVLTAGHVVSDRNRKPIAVFLGSVAGQTRVAVEPDSIHCHPELDIALIDLGYNKNSKQGIIEIDFQDRDLKGKKGDFHAFNRNSETCDVHRGHTIGTWYADRDGYLCDHQVLKGFSGGVVVIDGKGIGVIIERHKQDQQTLIIPAYRFHDWLREVLPPETLSRYFPASSTLPPVASRQVQTEFSALVRKKIGELLGNSRLRPLKAGLSEQLPEDGTVTDPVHVLVPLGTTFDIESSIDALHEATEACLEKARDDNPDALPHLVAGATDTLGWLILLAVSEDWAGADAVTFDQLRDAQHIRLPVETEAGTEVVSARLRGHKASMALADDGVGVRGACMVSPGELELGLRSDDALTETMKLIWKRVLNADPPIPFDASAQQQLAVTLKKRKRGRNPENYYITLPAGSGHDEQLLYELRSKLPDLDSFLIGSADGQQVLVIEEPALVVLIREFLLMCRKYP